MKRLLLAITIIGAICAFTIGTANAADTIYGQQIPIASNSVTVAAVSGTNVAKVIDCRKQASVGFQIEVQNDATGAIDLIIPFQRSIDGVNWATANATTISLPINGVTKQTVFTNVATWGAGYMRIPHITNATATVNVTNLIISYGVKINAP